MTLTLSELLRERAAGAPDTEVLVAPDRTVLDFGGWDREADRLAGGLAAGAVLPGERVALLFDPKDWTGYAIAYLAVHRAAGVAIHFTDEMDRVEMLRRVEECSISWILHGSSVEIDEVGGARTISVAVADLDPPEGWLPLDGSPCGLADIRYTSGTTGPAKAYQVPFANLTFGRTIVGMRNFGAADSVDLWSPMIVPIRIGTSSAATVLAIAVTSPARFVLVEPDNGDAIGRAVEDERAASIMLNPYVASLLVDHRIPERYDFGSVRTYASAAAPLAPATADRLLAGTPQATLEIACALSEASPAIITGRYDRKKPFAVGVPASNSEAVVVDKADRPIRDEVGELWLRSEAPKRLYLGQPELNDAIEADGWYRTGDLAEMGSDGIVHFFDRKADACVIGGKLRSTVRAEADLAVLDGVGSVAVVDRATGRPEPDERELVAFAVPATGVDPRNNGVVDRLLRTGTSQGPIGSVTLVEELPLTQTGKVLKRILREWAGDVANKTAI